MEYHKRLEETINKLQSRRHGDLAIRNVFIFTNEELKNTKISKVHYNYALVSFVGVFEALFKNQFINLINNNKLLKDKFMNSIKKIKLSLVEEYKKNKLGIGEIIAMDYNFQNLDSIQNAYKELGFDFYKLLDVNVKFKDKKRNRIELIKNLLEKRHNIVHNGEFYNTLEYKEIADYWSLLFMLGMDLLFQWLIPTELKKTKKFKN